MIKFSEIADDNMVRKFNASGPYYTSYPTLGEWSDTMQETDYLNALNGFGSNSKKPKTGLYIHFPYCPKQCYFCLCNVTITQDRKKINGFLQNILTEIDMLFNYLEKHGIKPIFQNIHLGGGTPSYLTEYELTLLVNKLKSWMDINSLKEFSIEFDPRSATFEKFKLCHELGFDRMSMGIQDFNEDIQSAINREHTFEMVEGLLTPEVRELFESINFDILYGLPMQTRESFHETIELIKKLSPDRITMLKYCHAPELKKHMKILDNYRMADEEEKALMFFDALDNFKTNGWEHISIDHFAKPSDSLVHAKKDKTMTRSFIGFSSGSCDNMLGIGPSSTIRVDDYYFQNTCNLNAYSEKVMNGIFPITSGYKMTDDDLIRREVIENFLCQDGINVVEIENRYHINFKSYFEEELLDLERFIKDDMLESNEHELKITELGKVFNRHICRVFDKFLKNKEYKIHGTGNKDHI